VIVIVSVILGILNPQISMLEP